MGIADSVAKNLVPPGIDGTLAWRLTVSLSIAAIGLWILWALGIASWIGSPGLARADEVEKLAGQVGEVQASLLADKIDAISTKLCMESFDAQLVEYRRALQEQFYEVKGRFHESPPCEILLKLSR